MGWLQRFGSRNHPEAKARKARMQKARAGMAVTPEMLANYTAARGFLYAEWLGASLMCASIALAYLFAGCPKGQAAACQAGTLASGWVGVAVPLAMCAAGGYVFWKNHAYYKRLDFPWAKRWDSAALVAAGAGVVFWFLFGLLVVLVQVGVGVAPVK